MAAGLMTEHDLPVAAQALLIEYGMAWLPAQPGDPPGQVGYLCLNRPLSQQEEQTFRTRWRACWGPAGEAHSAAPVIPPAPEPSPETRP